MLDKVKIEVYNNVVSKAELRSHLKRLSEKVNTVKYSYAVYCMSADVLSVLIFLFGNTFSKFAEVFDH